MPDDHSKVVPLLPIPNRTVKRLSADDSADSRVKVGHRQAITASKPPVWNPRPGVLSLGNRKSPIGLTMSALDEGDSLRPGYAAGATQPPSAGKAPQLPIIFRSNDGYQ